MDMVSWDSLRILSLSLLSEMLSAVRGLWVKIAQREIYQVSLVVLGAAVLVTSLEGEDS